MPAYVYILALEARSGRDSVRERQAGWQGRALGRAIGALAAIERAGD